MRTPLVPQLRVRDRRPELMDQPDIDPDVHAKALKGLARVNFFSRSLAIVWPPISELAKASDEPLSVLDVACGGGDLAIALAKRAQQLKVPIRISACDISETALSCASEQAAREQVDIEFFQADAIAGAFPGRYAVVMCSLFLHHLDDGQAGALLANMKRSAEQLVLVNDLLRSRWGYLLAYFGTRLLTRSPIVHTDGPLSVRAAYSLDEAERLAGRAGLKNATFTRHWPQRFLLAASH